MRKTPAKAKQGLEEGVEQAGRTGRAVIAEARKGETVIATAR